MEHPQQEPGPCAEDTASFQRPHRAGAGAYVPMCPVLSHLLRSSLSTDAVLKPEGNLSLQIASVRLLAQIRVQGVAGAPTGASRRSPAQTSNTNSRLPWLVRLSWLERHPINQKVPGSVHSPGTYENSPSLGCLRGNRSRFLSLSLSLPSLLSKTNWRDLW